MNKYEEAMKKLDEDFGGKDNLISISTISLSQNDDGSCRPDARLVDAHYENGAFYTVTYATSNKMLQIAKNPNVALCFVVDKLTVDGIAENLGWVCDEKNLDLMSRIRPVFAKWYDEANNDEDQSTCLLRVTLTKGLWFDAHTGEGTRVDFMNKTAEKV